MLKAIPGIEGYKASIEGVIYSKRLNRPMKTKVIRSGVEAVEVVCPDGTCKTKAVHRWVAMTFLPNPLDLPQVDHIDGNMLNNKYENLRCVGKRINRFNLRKYKNNTTGEPCVGVKDGSYYCVVQKDGERYFRGYFTDIETAIAARDKLYTDLDFHPNHGN